MNERIESANRDLSVFNRIAKAGQLNNIIPRASLVEANQVNIVKIRFNEF